MSFLNGRRHPRALRAFVVLFLIGLVLGGCSSTETTSGGDSGVGPMDGGLDASLADGSVADGSVADAGGTDAGVALPPSPDARQFVSDLIDRICLNYDSGCLDGSDRAVTAAKVQHLRDAYPSTVGASCRTAMLGEVLRGRYLGAFAPGDDSFDLLTSALLSSELRVPSDTSVSFDATAAASCLSALGAGCYDLGDLGAIAACRQTFGHGVALGDTCTDDWQCSDDAYCGPEVLGNGSCNRSVCRTRPAVGQPCLGSWDPSCATSSSNGKASCAYDANNDYVCGFTPIVVGVTTGNPCGAIGGTDYRCAPDLQCDYSTDYRRSGVCVARVAAAALCRPNGTDELVCEAGQTCAPTYTPTYDHRCVPISVVGVGADCSGDGAECDLTAGLTCEFSTSGETCVATYGNGAEDAPCRPKYGGDDCAAGLWCAATSWDRSVGVCAPRIPALAGPGEGCNSAVWWASTCLGPYACTGHDPTTSTCQPSPLADGLECELPAGRYVDCAAGHYCVYGPAGVRVCSSSPYGYQVANGTACDTDALCASGYCFDVGDYLGLSYTYRRCASRGGNGDACAIATNLGCNLLLYCDVASASPTCQPEVAEGSACTATYQCRGSGYCADEGDGMGMVCHSPRKADLALCGADRECLGALCRREDGTAAATRVCRTWPIAVGLGCSSASDCATHRCAKSTGDTYSTCQPPGALGASCTGVDAECQAGLICNPSSYDCSPLLADGSYCNWQNSRCASGNCWESYCKPKRPDGVFCQEASECASGNCAALTSGGPHYCMTGIWSYACF